MTAAATLAGAVPDAAVIWHAIPWRQVFRNVRRLQARIVKAIQQGRWGKAQALVHLLTHSFSGRACAVLRVTENPGKRTPGVDNSVWDDPDQKAHAVDRLRRREYHPQPLRRVYIPKGTTGQVRPLGIPTFHDRAMQALYLLGLEPIAETTGDPYSYGFRKDAAVPMRYNDVTNSCVGLTTRPGCWKGTSSRAMTGSAMIGC